MKPRIRYDTEKKRWECSNGKLSTCGYADNPKLAYDLHKFYVNCAQVTTVPVEFLKQVGIEKHETTLA